MSSDVEYDIRKQGWWVRWGDNPFLIFVPEHVYRLIEQNYPTREK